MPIDLNPDPKYSKAMVVVAHPDDAEYGCSGTVAKWCNQGWIGLSHAEQFNSMWIVPSTESAQLPP